MAYLSDRRGGEKSSVGSQSASSGGQGARRRGLYSLLAVRLCVPSPALVVACLALAISLSGAAYAVSTALPRNSVGALQLKNNAVNSAKVKNASLHAVDFAARRRCAMSWARASSDPQSSSGRSEGSARR